MLHFSLCYQINCSIFSIFYFINKLRVFTLPFIIAWTEERMKKYALKIWHKPNKDLYVHNHSQLWTVWFQCSYMIIQNIIAWNKTSENLCCINWKWNIRVCSAFYGSFIDVVCAHVSTQPVFNNYFQFLCKIIANCMLLDIPVRLTE